MSAAILPVLLAALVLGGCILNRDKGVASPDPFDPLPTGSLADPSQNALVKAQMHFRNEDYGLSETWFRRAVEYNVNNDDAWLGLAASYDRLRRFDLAERAYRVVVRKVGYTLAVHNNLGYHWYLRGDYARARKHFDAAYAMDPGNPYVLNNLKLLDEV
jgi:Flp pilus assembly protein TadD